MITVRSIAPEAVILGTSYIYPGETRQVLPSQLAEAKAHHPGAFAVVGGAAMADAVPASAEPPIEPAPIADDPPGAMEDASDNPPTLTPESRPIPPQPRPAAPSAREKRRRR